MDQLLDATARAERDHFWFRGFRRFVAPLLARAVAGVAATSGPRILDCGCGTGNNLRLLRAYGRPCGIDLTLSGLTYARKQGERLVAQASALSLPFSDNAFDLVTSFDVIYAFDDAMAATALREMCRVLRQGGSLVLNVAALPALRGNHSILGGEVQRYTRSGLRRHLEQAGFSVQRLTYTNFAILPLVAAVRFSQRLRQGGHELSDSEMSIPSPPINLTLAGLLTLESYALRVADMPLGSSLLTLARKR
jgi:ubiquinone/menaquinone biosynthesis C-methylase UbiE